MQYFLCKLVGPRADFALTVTPEEMELMQQHGVYWRELIEQEIALIFGLALDPASPYGLGILQVADASQAQAFTENDPAVLAGVGFRYEITPMEAITRSS